jgi:hypothetical protein
MSVGPRLEIHLCLPKKRGQAHYTLAAGASVIVVRSAFQSPI